MQAARQLRNVQVDPRAPVLEFRLFLDELPAVAYSCDAQGLISSFNRRAAQLLGREPRLNDPADRFGGSLRLFSLDRAPEPAGQEMVAVAPRVS